MKAHKYWSVGALITMIGTFYTGYKGLKAAHKYFAFGSLICMMMADRFLKDGAIDGETRDKLIMKYPIA